MSREPHFTPSHKIVGSKSCGRVSGGPVSHEDMRNKGIPIIRVSRHAGFQNRKRSPIESFTDGVAFRVKRGKSEIF